MPAPRSHCIVADVDLSMRRSPQVQRHKTRWRKRSYLGCHRKCLHHIPRRTLRRFFLPSAPRQLHRHFHPEVCKTQQIYIDVGIFISRCFFCSDIILCLGIFTQKLGGKTGILFETFFCTEQHDKTIQKLISLGIFFWPRHLFWESAEINAYRQVRHFFLPRGVCRYVIISVFSILR